MFLSDSAEFATPFQRPALNVGKWSQRIAKIGDNKVGNIFLKKAQDVTRELPNGVVKRTYGIANSGRTIRKTPLALAGLGLAGYGTYRTKKVYDKYKPEITMGRKLMRNYNALKTKFNWGGEN